MPFFLVYSLQYPRNLDDYILLFKLVLFFEILVSLGLASLTLPLSQGTTYSLMSEHH